MKDGLNVSCLRNTTALALLKNSEEGGVLANHQRLTNPMFGLRLNLRIRHPNHANGGGRCVEGKSTEQQKNRWSSAAFGGRGTVSPPKGGRRILSAVEVVFASRSMVYLTGRSRVFIPY